MYDNENGNLSLASTKYYIMYINEEKEEFTLAREGVSVLAWDHFVRVNSDSIKTN